MEEADGSEQAGNIRMLLPAANNRRYSTGALACYDGYFQSEREEAKLSRKALSAVPPLRSPHRRNYTSSHCAPPSPAAGVQTLPSIVRWGEPHRHSSSCCWSSSSTSSRPARITRPSFVCAEDLVLHFPRQLSANEAQLGLWQRELM